MTRSPNTVGPDRETVTVNDTHARCVLSHQRLTDPAKGSHCAHRACCNYRTLRDYVGRVDGGAKGNVCPLATCGVRLQRTRDVEYVAELQAALERADGAAAMWFRGDEMRTSAPPECMRGPGGGTARVGGTKRARQAGAASPEELRRSSRRNVIACFDY